MLGFNEGDVFVAYLKRHGFVGVGKVKTRARMIREIQVEGRSLLSLGLRCSSMGDRCEDPLRSEYVCLVEWLASVSRDKAKWRLEPKLYTTALLKASLDGQQSTVAFIEEAFGVPIREQMR
jgi:hypothetical protein